MRVALDTNILVYALGVGDPGRRNAAKALVARLPEADVVLPVQVLGELFRVLTGKARWTAAQARVPVGKWEATYAVQPTTAATLVAALDLTVDHRCPIWDAVILSAAADAGCRLLLSEDYSDGFVWRGVTVANPFASERHPLLTGVLRGRRE
jgi:predicted nucleic acid-binding protein